ncbi:hypothetical protein L1049_005803 [Liquidambar formosana]|uniref:MYND-type domain-containing protein n=1 Tax=Liquidambar formosana TaxID=63359 RepID=A0AAP0RG02_LIQFO
MECAGKGRRTRCTGPPTRRCARCEAVAYCSVSHQISHWNDHKEECERLEQQMKRADVLNDFPFTFTREATLQVCEKRESRCSFLSKRGIHRVGMWMCECGCGASVDSFGCSRLNDCWNLSSSLCPCSGIIFHSLSNFCFEVAIDVSRGYFISICRACVSNIKRLSGWKDYFEWRCIPLHSPVALLLHWPLTIYHATQLAATRSLNFEISNELCIHYLGPEKELLQLAVFGELLALFPGVRVHIELVGPAIPQYRDGERIDLYSFAHCIETDCMCRSSSENVSRGVGSGKTSAVTLQLRRGLGIGPNSAHALKVPFRVKDVLPVLPRQISWPVLNNLHSPVDLLPTFVGSVAPNNGSIGWKGACFYGNEARLEFTAGNSSQQGLGGGVLYLKTTEAHSWTCMDLYVFATPYRVTWDYYFTAREHTLQIESWEEPAELEYVKQHGISVFLMPSGMLGTFISLIDVLPLFSNTGWGQNANIAFLKNHMGATFEKRPQPWRATINPEDVHSGDFLALSKIRGRWGGFETLEKWVTGAFAGHTAVCLKDEMGNLWVGESGHENEKGEEIIVVIPWDEWWELSLKDNSNPHIALLPLHPELRQKFNSTAAWEYARSMSGKPYGYHNMIFSWIDTIADNYPPPLDAHLVISVMSMWTRVQPAYAANMWNEALNKRLGTEDLDLYGVLTETEKRGITFDQLLTIPEQDEWIYSDGKSTTCVAFILEMYKEAGIFGPISSSIQVTEFTIRDAYMLKIFENNQTHLPSWCNNEDGQLPFCQILGEYRMELPEYNTIEPYSNMNENCPSLPPIYDRPIRC